MVRNNVRHGLCISGRTGSATPYGIMDLCELIGDSVGNVSSGRCPTVRAQYNTVLEVYRHAKRGTEVLVNRLSKIAVDITYIDVPRLEEEMLDAGHHQTIDVEPNLLDLSTLQVIHIDMNAI